MSACGPAANLAQVGEVVGREHLGERQTRHFLDVGAGGECLLGPVMMMAPMPGRRPLVAALVTSFITWLFNALRAWGGSG